MVNIWASMKTFFIKCGRVWSILRKPTRKEFEQISKVSAIGILIIGVIAFLVSIIMKIFIR